MILYFELPFISTMYKFYLLKRMELRFMSTGILNLHILVDQSPDTGIRHSFDNLHGNGPSCHHLFTTCDLMYNNYTAKQCNITK